MRMVKAALLGCLVAEVSIGQQLTFEAAVGESS